MQITWIKQMTLLDFPWKVAAIIFTAWCNFRCPFCYNPDFVLPEKLEKTLKDIIPVEAFFNFLSQRIWMLDWVVICWWEPTIHADLYDFAKRIKDMWFAVKLDTNGRDPALLSKLIEDKIIDYVAMDIKDDLDNYKLSGIENLDSSPYKESVKILLNSNIDYEFRTTVIKWYHDEEKIKKIAQSIAWAPKYCLQNFQNNGNLLKPDFDGASFSNEELEELREVASEFAGKVEVRK